MPEALARADYDYTISEESPRRRARPRNGGRIEPTVSRVPQMRNGASKEPSLFARLFRFMLRRPLRTLVSLACGAVLISFASNLLFMQEGPHPAPLFVKHEPKPADATAANPNLIGQGQPAQSAPPLVASRPAIDPPEPASSSSQLASPQSAPRSAPPSIVPAPPARRAEQSKPAANRSDFDPIAQFLRTGAASAPATTASTSAPEPKRVAAVQRALSKLGHKLDIDGIMGPGTRAAIQKFERDNKLPATGEMNPRTLKALSARASIAIP